MEEQTNANRGDAEVKPLADRVDATMKRWAEEGGFKATRIGDASDPPMTTEEENLRGRVRVLEDLLWRVHDSLGREGINDSLRAEIATLVGYGHWPAAATSTGDEQTDRNGVDAEKELQHLLSLLGAQKRGDLLNAIAQLQWLASQAPVAQKMIQAACQVTARAATELTDHHRYLAEQASKVFGELQDLRVPPQIKSGAPGDTDHESPAGELQTMAIAAEDPFAAARQGLPPLLEREPTLMAQLYEVLRTGRWLVTLHAKVKDSPPDDLQSYSTMNGFPVAEVSVVMQAQCRAILADEARKLQRLDAGAAQPRPWR